MLVRVHAMRVKLQLDTRRNTYDVDADGGGYSFFSLSLMFCIPACETQSRTRMNKS